MPYQFTSTEQTQLQAAQALCPQGSVATSTGNWVPFYTTLSTILGQRISGGVVTGSDLQDMRNAKLWLDVAIGANGGTGMHSAFIRTYTNLQGELRSGSAFSAGEMQKASNGVALNLWNNLSSPPSGTAPWQVPPINDIARLDAKSIGDYLFGSFATQQLPSDDTAITANAAWSGAIGFNLLGGAAPYESWRLLTGGDGASNTGSTANKYDDFKNLLFAVHAYEQGLKAGYAQGGSDFVNFIAASQYAAATGQWPGDNAGPFAAQLAVVFASGNVFGLVKDVAARTPGISPIVKSIANMGVNKFLDMLMGAKDGVSKLGSTTDANFASNAKAFFSALTPAELGSLNAKLLPGSPSDIATLAQSDVNVRAALVAGSFVSVQVSTTVANSAALKLHDPATGQGSLTKEWLQDRSYFVTALGTGKPDSAGQLWRSDYLPVNRSFEFRYVDANGTEQIILAENTARAGGATSTVPSQLIFFGGDAADTLTGSSNALGDKLYGGAGADTLNGQGGADYLEGGVGVDTYQFTATFGKDTILDTDGLGVLQIDGTTLTGGKGAGRNIWLGKDSAGNTEGYAVYDDKTSSTGKKLVITRAGNVDNTITIDNFDLTAASGATGYLGIKLDPTKQLALIQGNGTTVGAATANVWADVNFNAASLAGKQSDIVEGTGKSFTLNLNQGAKAGDTLTLALSSLADKFKAILGDSVVDANGAVITLVEGQTQVSFALVQSGDVTADASMQLSASYTGVNSSATSNAWSVNLKDTGPLTSTYNGEQRAKLIGIEIDTQILPGNPLYNTYKWSATSWAEDGTLTGGIAEPNFSDVIYGTASNDRISGGSANDALSGDGNDILNGDGTTTTGLYNTTPAALHGDDSGFYAKRWFKSTLKCSNIISALARSVRLAGRKGLGSRTDRAWKDQCRSDRITMGLSKTRQGCAGNEALQ